MRKFRKMAKAIEAMECEREIYLRFSSIKQRTDQDFDKKVKYINDKLKGYCSSKGFLFIDNYNI